MHDWSPELRFFRPETILAGLFLASLGGLVQYARESGWEHAPDVQHHYGFQAVAVGVTFALVFRTQLAWGRFWEAVTHLHVMYSKLLSQDSAVLEASHRSARLHSRDLPSKFLARHRNQACDSNDEARASSQGGWTPSCSFRRLGIRAA